MTDFLKTGGLSAIEEYRGEVKPKAKSETEPDVDKTISALEKMLENGEFLSKGEAEKVKETYLALQRKIEYEEKAGTLVNKSEITKKMFELWREERDALINLPVLIGPEIAGKFGINSSEMIIELERKIREYLEQRTNQPRLSKAKDLRSL